MLGTDPTAYLLGVLLCSMCFLLQMGLQRGDQPVALLPGLFVGAQLLLEVVQLTVPLLLLPLLAAQLAAQRLQLHNRITIL